MARGRPEVLNSEQKRELWSRWKAGDCVADIALAVSRHPIEFALKAAGGIAPRDRGRAPRCLSLEEREAISRGLARGESMRCIAASLGRPACTICREVKRNGGPGAYRASRAEARAWEAAKRPKRCLLASNATLRRQVAGKLSLDWSPEQISYWLKRQYPNNDCLRVSAETIYRSLFVQARGALKKELVGHLRSAARLRRPGGSRTAGQRGQIVDAVPISQRPAEVEDRAVPGHWEGDLICGSSNSHIATLVERQTRFVMLVKVPSKETATVVAALSKHVRRLPAQLRRSLTWDRGHEMADHAKFTFATDVQVYFCDPQSPWQRGSNENTNGLLRQYFKKGTDLSVHSQAHLDSIALRLNQRPRKTLGFASPAETLADVLQ